MQHENPATQPLTKEALAARLHGREYRREISRQEEVEAKAAGLVVVYGASDDLIEVVGAFSDERGADDGMEFLVDAQGLLGGNFADHYDCDNEDQLLAHLQRRKQAKTITANWDAEGYSWTYTTDIPHATFDILEDGDRYCRGLVFHLNDLQPAAAVDARQPPYLTPADIEAAIASEWYINGATGVVPDEFQPPVPVGHPLGHLTLCVLVLRNGTKVVGVNYGAINPANCDPVQAKRDSRADAVRQVWPLLGYALREQLLEHPMANLGQLTEAERHQLLDQRPQPELTPPPN